MHQSLSKAEGRTVKVNDCTGRYTKQAEGPGLTHTRTHTCAHACMRSHTPFGCVAVSTQADDRAIIHWSVPRGQGLGWTA